jgi:hypothetical protein
MKLACMNIEVNTVIGQSWPTTAQELSTSQGWNASWFTEPSRSGTSYRK